MAVSRRSLSAMPKHYFEICDRFKLVRLEEKLTQEDFAKAIGLTESYIKALENRNSSPNIFSIQQLHKHFGRNYDWIIDGKGKKKG